jgi:hypothetical protein
MAHSKAKLYQRIRSKGFPWVLVEFHRYKEGVYAIPYEGEELKFYWANSEQYYVKTAESGFGGTAT